MSNWTMDSDIIKEIEKNKKNFLLHNVVRLREMIRYLPPEKLDLFKEIPFLIHVNSPEFPGYVKISEAKLTLQNSGAANNINSINNLKSPKPDKLSNNNLTYDKANLTQNNIFGVWNFENSGFAKDISEENPAARELLKLKCNNPVVQAIYHIGSLGTFTQSAKSDFDFWVVIEKNELMAAGQDFLDSNQMNQNELASTTENGLISLLHEKLSLITTYSRKAFSQEVTFFVHYAHNLRENAFDNPDDEDKVAVPELLLKEEFYRTFIMVAGKIPLWAVQPLGLDSSELDKWKKYALDYGGFIDLGTFDSMPIEEIQRGLLWQICKAPYDPVKSVIKASITASYIVKKNANKKIDDSSNKEQAKVKPILLCDMVKQRFGESIIDDYAADPYIIAFERILGFYEERGDQGAVSQIKAAIFFRLCGFPFVSIPPKDSPKRKILDRYVRKWQLSNTRLKKLLEYQIWSESEKTLFDQTMINRLSSLYKDSLQYGANDSKTDKIDYIPTGHLNKRESDLKILKNKVNKITVKKKGVLHKCSTYLSLKPQSFMILLLKEQNPKTNSTQIGSSSDDNYSKGQSTQVFSSKEWLLFSAVQNRKMQTNKNQNIHSESVQLQSSLDNKKQSQNDPQTNRYNLLYSAKYFMEAIGWSMYNHLYIRGTTRLEIKSDIKSELKSDIKQSRKSALKIYGSFEKETDCDEIYLALQPWMPLSDEPFLSAPVWEKIVVLLVNDDILEQLQRAEFLIRNSWGEIYFEVLNLAQIENLEERYHQTAMKIFEYNKKESIYSIFQMASKPIPKLIQKIKTIVEDTKILKNSFEKDFDINTIQRRPYLDVI